MPNLDLVKKTELSAFRRIAIGTWRTAYDPTVYGSLTLHMDEAVRYMEEYRRKTGKRLTVTHMVGKAMGAVFQTMPDANAILRFNRIYLRKRIGIFFQVALEDEETGQIDLSGCTIYDPEQKDIGAIIDEFEEKTQRVRKRQDKELEGTRSTFKRIPFVLLNKILDLIGLASFTFNLDLRWAGIPQDPFGSMMLTNIGSLKLDEAYAPLVPYSRIPLVATCGAIIDTPVIRDGAVVPGKLMKLNATFDHRVLDGAHMAAMVKTMRKWMESPYEHFGPIPEGSAEAPAATATAASA